MAAKASEKQPSEKPSALELASAAQEQLRLEMGQDAAPMQEMAWHKLQSCIVFLSAVKRAREGK